jgi:predicted helicase
MIDSLVETYKCTDIHAIMHKEFTDKKKDPVLHFYETFLTKYNSDLRKSRGVYYTPEPVVSFIVRSIDQILKTKFDLPKGLADTTKIKQTVKIAAKDKRTKDGIKQIEQEIHKVQILDPAAGTGTFLNEVILEIYKTFKGQEGAWSNYAQNYLLPRLHGFELMMASYTMAHLKLGVTLSELGYKGKDRLSVWLTNSLEEGMHEMPNLFMSQWLTEESNQASYIKSEMPIMVVLGNPPYSVSSSNKGENIQNLIKVYKEGLNERKINLDDDYIKFIRFAEHQIEQTGYGVVAMITNNSFIDGVTHRQMRKHLMETFDEIYILDLHGNVK